MSQKDVDSKDPIDIDFSRPLPETDSNIISRLFFSWLSPLISMGFTKPLEEEHMWRVHPSDTSEKRTIDFQKTFSSVRKKRGDSNCVAWSLLYTRLPEFLLCTLLKMIGESVDLVAPTLVGELIGYVESGGEKFYPWIISGVLIISFVCRTFIMQQYVNLTIMIGITRATSCMGAVFQKSLRISMLRRDSESEKKKKKKKRKNKSKKLGTGMGEVTNLMKITHYNLIKRKHRSNDCQRIRMASALFQNLWFQPVFIIISLCLVYNVLGVSGILGFIIMVLFVPLQIRVTKWMIGLRRKTLDVSDKRIDRIHGAIIGVRAVKLIAWAESIFDQVVDVREDELKILKKSLLLQALNSMLVTACPVVVSAVSFVCYVQVFDNKIDAKTVFTALAYFNILSKPLRMYPRVLTSVIDGWVACCRIQDFLLRPELERLECSKSSSSSPRIRMDDDSKFSWSASSPSFTPSVTTTSVAVEMSAVIPMPRQEPQKQVQKKSRNVSLKIDRLDISGDKLVCVVGPVGAFKSSLLGCVLGEMPSSSTTSRVHVTGSVAYVPQDPFIMNATLRDNVLFGNDFEKERYDRVVAACALLGDIKVLPDGELTEIGERGINLSGGQRMRVGLARALYSNADIYLIDDALAAVDSHVGLHIFREVYQNALRGKLRVVVLHQLHYVPKADYVIVMSSQGHISEQGTYDELVKREFGELNRLLSSVADNEEENLSSKHEEDEEEEAKGTTSLLKRKKSNNESTKTSEDKPEKLMEKEDRMRGTMSRKHWLGWARAGGYSWFFAAMVAIASVVASSLTADIWLSLWADGKTGSDDDTYAIVVYTSICGIVVLLSGVQAVLIVVVSLNASRTLFGGMFRSVLRAPVQWFDVTPTGRILSRFSRDIQALDEQLPQLVRSTIDQFFGLVATMAIVCWVFPYALIIVIPLMYTFYRLQNMFRASSREIKRLESTSRSPIYSNFEETLGGISVISAFSVQNLFTLRHHHRTDVNLPWLQVNFIAMRWLGVRLELIGHCVVAFVAFFIAAASSTLTPGSAGVALVYSLTINRALQMLVRNVTDLELGLNSIERIEYYTKSIPQEKDYFITSSKRRSKPKDWPSRGEIVIENLDIRYRPNLPLVLKNVSLTVKPHFKVGVVGRTGSGKSTLALGLFRIVEASSGSIKIDGVNIARDISLNELRSALAIVPQSPTLFEGTVRSNLDPFNQSSDADCWTALKRVQLDKKLSESTGLYTSVLNGGKNWSAGERQLLCMARALLRKNKVLVLDEASAFIDQESDARLQEMIRTEFRATTVITIAHRLETIIDYDRVLVLDNGSVAEFDHPHILLQKSGGIFKSLVESSGSNMSSRLARLARDSYKEEE